jgi:hypothetical protein
VDTLPGMGFFEWARALKRGPGYGETDRDLHDRLLDEVDAFLDGNQQSAPE